MWGRGGVVLGMTAAALTLAWAPLLAVYMDDPPVAHTGGFGEPTCNRCHFDGPVDDPEGALALLGVPEAYTPGERYLLTVTLTRPGMERGGFELAARYAAGEAAGRQAGALRAVDGRAEVTRADPTGVEYVHHTVPGVGLVAPDSARWRVEWTAPEAAAGGVVFHLAGNAANGDDSEFGDHIYTASARTKREGT